MCAGLSPASAHHRGCPAPGAAGVDGHAILDLIGVLDPLGISDGINALWYAAEGDYVNAAIRPVAIVPLVGDIGKGGRFAAKYGDDIVEAASHVDDVASAVTKGADEFVDFAHGTSVSNAEKILNEGVSQQTMVDDSPGSNRPATR